MEFGEVKAWIFYATVPVLTLGFIVASALAYKTYRHFTFDSGVLLMCALINALAILCRVFCLPKLDSANQCIQTCMLIIMLFFTCQIFDNHTGQGRSVGHLICSVGSIVLLGLFVDSMAHVEEY